MKKYEDLTEEEKNEIGIQGCGGKGSVIKPPHRIFFKTSCDKHDYSYFLGHTEADRLKADQGLYRAMISDCKKLSWFKYIRYRPWCWFYYVAVRQFGKKYFYYSDCYNIL